MIITRETLKNNPSLLQKLTNEDLLIIDVFGEAEISDKYLHNKKVKNINEISSQVTEVFQKILDNQPLFDYKKEYGIEKTILTKNNLFKIFWEDGSVTYSKPIDKNSGFDPRIAFSLAFTKHYLGNKDTYESICKKAVDDGKALNDSVNQKSQIKKTIREKNKKKTQAKE